jgi:hypothetical protein
MERRDFIRVVGSAYAAMLFPGVKRGFRLGREKVLASSLGFFVII